MDPRAEYIAGFFDGDGTITLKPPGKGRGTHPAPYAALSQAHNAGEPPELVHVQALYGGTMLKSRDATSARRSTWMLTFSVEGTERLLEDVIARHGIAKRLEAESAIAYLRSGRVDAQTTHDFLVAAKKDRQDIHIDPARITPAYLAGLFTADGTVTLNRGLPFVNIAAKRCIKLLRAIRDKLGYGTVYADAGWIGFHSAVAVQFLEHIRPHLPNCQKLPQVRLTLEYANSMTFGSTKRKTPEQIARKEETLKELKRMKRM